jgi:AraC family transcriptional regulator
MMSKILPAGQHYGKMLQSWSSDMMFVCRIRYDQGATYGAHGNQQASLIFVQTGHCSKRMGREHLELSRSSMLFIPPEHLQADSFPLAATFLAAEFDPSFLRRMGETPLRRDEHVQFKKREAQDLGARLMRELTETDEISDLVFEGIALNALACAYRTCTVRHRRPPAWLTRARNLLHDCAFDSLKLSQIARDVGVHPAQLSREFRNFFKETPGEYLRGLRVEAAANSLADTQKTLAEVALCSGFADQAHLTRVFQRHRQVSPSAYRRLVNPQKRSSAHSH